MVFQFGLVVRGQFPADEDIARGFAETIAFVRRADALGFDSLTKTAHYSAHPFQMLQQVPMLARFAAEAPRLRLNAGVVLLPLLTPLAVAEVEFATLDVMSGGKVILGVGLGYRARTSNSTPSAPPAARGCGGSRRTSSRSAGCGAKTP